MSPHSASGRHPDIVDHAMSRMVMRDMVTHANIPNVCSVL